jgi:hypothetical protein
MSIGFLLDIYNDTVNLLPLPGSLSAADDGDSTGLTNGN